MEKSVVKKYFAIGNNYDGCLLTGDTNDLERWCDISCKLKEFSKDESIDLCVGIRNCVAISSKKVYFWGRSILSDTEEPIIFNPIVIKTNITIIKSSLSIDHALFLGINKSVYSLGKGNRGELGLGAFKTFSGSLTEVQILEKELKCTVSQIFTNLKQSFCITEEKKVFAWGYNKFNELGIENMYYNSFFYPTKIDFSHAFPEPVFIENLTYGRKHTIFVGRSFDNCLSFVCGDNSKNVFSGEEKGVHKMHINKFLSSDNIRDVKCGWNNTYVLLHDDKKVLLCYGDNRLNQLGHQDKSLNFNKINHSKDILDLYVGTDFCYFVDQDKDLYSFGWNEHYNLGLNHQKVVENYSLVDFNCDEIKKQSYKLNNGGAFTILELK